MHWVFLAEGAATRLRRGDRVGQASEPEEEFFCLSTEDVRAGAGDPALSRNTHQRSRNNSASSRYEQIVIIKLFSPWCRVIEMATAETKIFSVAVEAGRAAPCPGYGLRNPVVREVEQQPVDRPVILRTPSTQCAELNSEDEFSPAVRDAVVEDGEVAARFETSDMADELETALQEPPALVLQQTQGVTITEPESKRSKKNKKKKEKENLLLVSSADETRETEAEKSKKKKCKKSKEEEPEKTAVIVEAEQELSNRDCKETLATEQEEVLESDRSTEDKKTPDSSSQDTFSLLKSFVREKLTYDENFSPDKDLVEFSEEESRLVDMEDNEEEDSEKSDFFIREKSSSVEKEDGRLASDMYVDPTAAKPNPWFNDFLKKSSSMIEDQIFGAVRKYENENNDEDDDGMLEMERNQEDTELRIVEMLEEEEPAEHPITDHPSSNLPQILKLEPKLSETPKDIPETYSSDDDFMFRPVPNKRKQKKQKFKAADSEEIFPR